jgi:23S rRNA (pseudouridine1915-N3)-methyltransferase
MKIGIVAVGRLKAGPERDLADRYAERFAQSGRALALTGPAITEIPESAARSAAERNHQEGEAILAAVDPETILIALDERGRTMGSEAFAARLSQWRDGGRKSLTFVIGGADGLSDAVRVKAQETLSFGAMTMPHQLVRILLLEQIYRAVTILSGHPYHRS